MTDERTRWPTTLGTIGIVLGVILILDQFDELITLRWTAAQWRSVVGPYLADWIVHTLPPAWWRLLSAAVQIGLGVLLVAASVALRRRSRAGVARCRVWAWLAIGWVVVVMGQATLWLFRHRAELSTLVVSGWAGYAVFALGLAFVLLLAFPVFLLVWLSRPETRAEHEAWDA